ncbi:conjugal transfer protein TraN [Thalassotalea piscium]|uniref:Uncharacterized protein n=1 Tax=Thalassotalea piscium TaxID=1230533 RepID=A0A7X0NGT8_9GAMM|nr:hypothetical protein [Thalassotalea piscium]MBB6543110.1 hypothetical protein [Thalassotalea piscium]
MSAFIAVNSVITSFYPSLGYAAQAPALTKAEKAHVMNKGQWDGALMIKQFKMPELKKDDAPVGLDPVTGEYKTDDSHYTDATKQHLKNEVYLQQLFPEYSQSELNTYLNDVNKYITAPELIQDDLTLVKDDIAFYKNIDCETLTDDEENKKCKRSQLSSALDDMKDNAGKALFGGKSDSILQVSSDMLDGTHPYYQSLYQDECKEVVKKGADGGTIVPSETRICVVQMPPQKASCKAERFMESQFVETKTLMRYSSQAEYTVLRKEFTDVYPCPNDNNCIMIDMKPTTNWNNSAIAASEFSWASYGAELKFAPGIKIKSAKLVELKTDMPNDSSGSAYEGHISTMLATDVGMVYQDPVCMFAGNYDWQARYWDNMRPHYKCLQMGSMEFWRSNTIEESAPIDLNANLIELNPDNTINFYGAIIDSYAAASPYHTSVSHGLDNSQKIKLFFEKEVLAAPVPETNTIVTSTAIDEIADYPKQSLVNVLGDEITVTIDVWDEDVYPSSRYFPTNFQATGPTITSFKVIDHGRPTNKWLYQIELAMSEIGPFEITADLHEVVEQGMRPMPGEDNCQPVIDMFKESTFPGTASCDYALGERFNDQGVVFNETSLGYLNLMDSWGENGNPPLEKKCWEATLVVDPQSGVGISDDEKGLTCAGLEGDTYDDCMAGKWCTYDEINGQEVCYDTAGGLKIGFADACKSYIENPSCTHESSETVCEDWGKDEHGNDVCIAESHQFKCDIDTKGFGIPESDETEIVCGGPIECMNGECSNIAKESNTAFVKAAVLQEVANEVKRNGSCAVDKFQTGSCNLFQGEHGLCKQPQLWGAQDCCDPDGLGMGGMDVIAYWDAAKYLEMLTENDNGAGWLSQAWTGVSDYVMGTDSAPTAMGSAYNVVADAVTGAPSTITGAIQTGLNSFAQELGFNPIFEVTKQAVNETAVNTINAVQSSAVKSAFSGVYQWIAQGVFDFLNTFAPALAKAVFSATKNAAGELIVDGWSQEMLGQTIGMLVQFISFVMMVYAIYNLVVGMVYGCEQEDFQTAQKIKLLQTHYVGSYCSQNTVFGCTQYSQSHCLYSSPFSRILAEQLRKQKAEKSGIPLKEAWIFLEEDGKIFPQCKGFTLEEIEQTDWDRIDLSEFEAIIMARMKYDPNNMPADFTPSEKGAGGRTGPQAGITSKESNIAAIKSIATPSDQLKDTLVNHNMQMTNPEYMPWYDKGNNGTSSGCTFECTPTYFYNSASGLCEKSIDSNITPTKSCDSANGYAYDSAKDLCIKVLTDPIVAGCPQAYLLNADSGMCESINYKQTDADVVCLVDHHYNENTGLCEKRSTMPTTSDCSAHGAGYVYQDGLCVFTLTQDVQPLKTCPSSDYGIVSGICVYSSTLPYTVNCPAGELYDSGSGQCLLVSEVSSPVIKSCPVGFQQNEDKCVKREQTPSTLICDTANGWVLNVNTCKKTELITSPANKGCPDGFTVNDSITGCEKFVPATQDTPKCDTGWTLSSDNKHCYKHISEIEPAKYSCDIGFSYEANSGECVREVQYPIAHTCDHANGFYYNTTNGVCEKIEFQTQTASSTCHSPAVLNNGMCETPVSSASYPECSKGYVYNNSNNLCEKSAIVVNKAIISCPTGYDVVGTNCVKVIEVSANKICPVGAPHNPITDQCEKIVPIITEMTPTCEEGYRLEGNQCVSREVVNAAGSCVDPTYTYDPFTKKCFKEEEDYVEAIKLCPETSPEFLAGLCESKVVKEPLYECPFGFFYSYENDICESQLGEFVDPVIMCESGWTYDKTLKICYLTDTHSGVTCEAGFTHDSASGTCTQIITQPASTYCQKGYAFDGASCIEVTHEQYSCQTGYQYNSASKACELDEDYIATLVCEPGFTLVGTVCVNDSAIPPSCPADHTYNSTTKLCELPTTKPADDVCPSGYYDNGFGCARLLTAAPTCDNGLAYDSQTGICSTSQSYPLENYCEVGVDSGVDCRILEQRYPTCDPDYFYNTTTQLCEKEESVRGTPYCEVSDAYPVELVNERCAYYSVTALLPNGDCQENYALVNGECIKYEEFHDPLYECPPDYLHIQDSSGLSLENTPMCIKISSETPLCDTAEGFGFANGFCEKYHIKNYAQRCIVNGQYEYGAACTSGVVDSLQCPSGFGYSQANDRCEFIELVNYEKSCSSPYTLVNGQCETTATTTPSCDINFAFNSSTNQCEPITQLPTCPSGYIYNNSLDKCELKQEVDADGDCPSGSEDSGSGCTAFHEARCNQGYKLDTILDQCTKKEQIAANSGCSGSQLDTGSGCVIEELPICSNGYSYNDATNLCHKTETIGGNQACPSGYMDIGGGCVIVERPDCNDGYTFVDSRDQCEKLESMPRSEGCEPGMFDNGMACLEKRNPNCPTGYSLNHSSDLCEKLETQPAGESCPSGTFYNGGLCYAFQAPSCSTAGYTYDSSLDKCKKQISTPAIGGCSTGTDTGNGCSTLETAPFDCGGDSYNPSTNMCEGTTTVPATQSCPSGSVKESGGCRGETPPRCKMPFFQYNPAIDAAEKCERNDSVCNGHPSPICNRTHTLPYCDQGYNLTPGKCVANTLTPFVYTCSSGNLNGSTCEVSQPFAPVCPTGYAPNFVEDRCEKGGTIGHDTYTCPSGGWSLSGSTCYKWDYQSPYCGGGYSYNTSNNRCEANTGNVPDASCPTGWTQNGNNCTRILTSNPSCPPTYGYNSSSNKCERSSDYQYSCPSGWVMKPSSCERILTAPPVCENGLSYQSQTNQCEGGNIGYTYTCDPGWLPSGNNCEREVTEAAECPPGYILDTDKDVCRSPEGPYDDFACPSGWVLNQNKCERTLSHAPICDPGFSYNTTTDRCEADNDFDYNYSCDAGWTLNNDKCFRYIYDDPTCDASYIFNNDVCNPYVEKPQVKQCPPDFDLIGNTCHKTTLDPPSCPAGTEFSPQSNECSRIEISITGFQCASGWLLNGNICEMEVASSQGLMCGPGYNFDSATMECTKTDYAYPIYICPGGYQRLEDERSCRKIVDDTAQPIGMTCPYTGFELVGNECVLTYSVEVDSYCLEADRDLVPTPTGVVFTPPITTEMACMKIIRKYDGPTFDCPIGYDHLADAYCTIPLVRDVLFTCLENGAIPDLTNKTCTRHVVEVVPPILLCAQDSDQVGGMCKTYLYASPTLSCSNVNATLIQGTCRHIEIVDTQTPLQACQNGSTPNGTTCTGLTTSYPTYSCPTGWVVNAMLGLCTKEVISTAPSITSCPLGGVINMGVCQLVTKSLPYYGCPTSAWVLDGTTCKREFTQTKAADICDTGDFLRFGACYSKQQHAFVDGCLTGHVYDSLLGVCNFSQTVYSTPVTMCNTPGYKPSGDMCVKYTVQDVQRNCSDPTNTILGGRCYEDVVVGSSPTYSCYKGYVDIGSGVCQLRKEAPVVISCPINYLYDSATGLCITDVVEKKPAAFNCPTGYTKLDDFLCSRIDSTTMPTYECADPTQLYNDKCITKAKHVISPGYCEPPYEMEGGGCKRYFSEGVTIACPSGSKMQGNKCVSTSVMTAVPVQTCS